MYLQEDTLFDLWLWPWGNTQFVAEYPLHHVTYALAKFEVAMSKGLGHEFTRKSIIHLLFDLCDVVQYPLLHVTYALVKFEGGMSSTL